MASKELDANEKMILNVILLSKTRNYWEMETLGDMLGISRQLVAQKIKSLIDKNYLFRQKPKGKRYYLTYATDKAKKQFLPNIKMEQSELKALFDNVIGG